MKDETGVRISEFLDGELFEKELDLLLVDMENSEAQQSLKNFSRISHAIRGENDTYSTIDVSQAVANAIAGMKPESAALAETRSTGIAGWLNSNWFKPALGAAFASVVAVVTVVVNQNAIVSNGSQGVPQVAQQQVAPKTYDLAQFARSSDDADKEIDKDVAAREELNQYLVNHARSASGNNYQGMVPYVRAVAYEPGQQKK